MRRMEYKEALERARKFHKDPNYAFADKVIIDIFPELKESEDERMMNQLHSWMKEFGGAEEYTEKVYQWIKGLLEKQGEQKPLKVYRVENEAEEKGLWRKFDGTWQPLFDMLTDGKCKDMPMEDNPIYREGGKRWFASAPSKEALREWFSKRDLEELVSKGFTITEFEITEYKKVSDFEYIFTRDNIISKSYLEVSDIYSEQKPADKVEPKFKVGDWIVNHNVVYHIDKISGVYLTLSTLDGTALVYHIRVLVSEYTRLWTIQDAKAGDVLCDYHEAYDNPLIFILKKFEHVNFGLVRPSDYSSYCYLTADDRQRFKEGTYHHKHNIKPATKEQRDLLFQKMKEAGYEWLEETKERKKIEQKPAWSEEDMSKVQRICKYLNEVKKYYADITEVRECIDWLKSLKERIGE